MTKKSRATAADKKAKKKVAVDANAYLKDLLALRKKDEPPNFAMLVDALHGNVTRRIPTGVLGLDKQTGGGFAEGRIIEVAAWEGVGKSTLLDQAAAQCQRMNGIVHLIDSEKARDLKYTRSLGVDVSKCILGEADDVEEGFEQIDQVIAVQTAKRVQLAKTKQEVPPILCLWDSIGGTPAREELKGAPDDAHVMAAARVISMNFRRIVAQLAENRITLVFANHFYQQIGNPALKTYGGKGVRYYPSIRLWLSRTGPLKYGDQTIGHAIKSQLRKTKVGPPQPDEMLGMVHGAGIDNSYTLYEWGKGNGNGATVDGQPHRWIVNRGRYSYLVPPGHETITFERGFRGLGEKLADSPGIYGEFVAAYMEAA